MTDAPTLLAIAKESRRLCKINKAMNCCDSCAKCAANILKEEASDQFAPLHLCTLQARFFTAAYIALKCAFYWASNDRTTPCCLMVTTFCSGCIECGLFISLAGKDAPMCQQLLCLMLVKLLLPMLILYFGAMSCPPESLARTNPGSLCRQHV